MSDLSANKPAVERWLEAGLFHSRWLMAPFYLGLVVALAVLLVVFFNEAVHEFQHALSMTPEGAILMVLSLIDLSLAGNLLLIVIFSGYENFVSKIDTATLSNANGPTTSKRSIESNVVVDDGSIIVIGGLLEDSYSQGQDKVPVMGDIPVLGNLFRSENRTRNKTNLMVFLRPIVVRDNATSDALMMDRYEAIRALQQTTQPAPSVVMKSVSGAPILPALPQRTDPGAVTVPAQPLAPLPAESSPR